MSRPYVRAHEPMLIEWLTKNYPAGSWRTNRRLGRPTPSIEAQIAAGIGRKIGNVVMFVADAVVVLPDRVDIIEVATEPKVEKVCQLKLYGHLFGTTEEYRAYWHLPRSLIIVSTVENELIQHFARVEGVRWIVYVPVWWAEHTAIRQARKFVPPAVETPESLKESD